ncbi:MAG TPA: hypothetical protein VN937_23895, partial [Blastocatellia bacterium]|nr:hypothetical protein [Blastocatellia bacterium]
MRNARTIRWDELAVGTPFALSQLAHKPRFPVVNTNIGEGQNMLVVPYTPVLHIVTVSRPATWGYFLLGAQRGLAWYWWFPPFACFTVLFLLFEVVLGGNRKLAALGAFWFCNSAYVICWSLLPDHVIFFAALGCLSAYHLLNSEKRGVRLASAILLGLSIPGFIMIMYPPWQVGAAYFMLFVFASLIIRDKLYVSPVARLRHRIAYIGVALVIAAGLTLSWLLACLPDLKMMSNSVYPGHRISLGGDYSLALLFKGVYNMATIYDAPPALRNQSEAASFYYLFPAVLIGLCLSRRFARKLGVAGWAMVAYISGALIFLFVGLPQSIAKLTLLSYIPSYRADLTIGLASILLSMRVLAITRDLRSSVRGRWEKLWPMVAGIGVLSVLLWHAFAFAKETNVLPSTRVAVLTAVTGGLASYCLLSGRVKVFAAFICVLVVATTILFNPLSTNLNHIYKSELAGEITRLNRQSDRPPLWVCYGGVHPGVLVTILGGRSVSGVHWPPQLSMWHVLDPDRIYEYFYNRYAEVSLDYMPDVSRVSFRAPQDGELRVMISPDYPGLKTLGARYLLVVGEAQDVVPAEKFHTVSRS